MATEVQLPEIEELDHEQGVKLLDEAAQRYLGISGEEFIRLWDAGEVGEDTDHPEVMRVALLLPFAR